MFHKFRAPFCFCSHFLILHQREIFKRDYERATLKLSEKKIHRIIIDFVRQADRSKLCKIFATCIFYFPFIEIEIRQLYTNLKGLKYLSHLSPRLCLPGRPRINSYLPDNQQIYNTGTDEMKS